MSFFLKKPDPFPVSSGLENKKVLIVWRPCLLLHQVASSRVPVCQADRVSPADQLDLGVFELDRQQALAGRQRRWSKIYGVPKAWRVRGSKPLDGVAGVEAGSAVVFEPVVEALFDIFAVSGRLGF